MKLASIASDMPEQRLSDLLFGAAAWFVGWGAMVWLEARVDLANLAMVMVLASAIASMRLPFAVSCVVTAFAVGAFNWRFVPPQYTLSVDLGQHALLLIAMLAVAWIIAGLMGRQRSLALQAQQQGERIRQLHLFNEALRDSHKPAQQAELLFEALKSLLGTPPRLLVLHSALPISDDDANAVIVGEPSLHERSGLWQCVRQAVPFGPGTGRHSELREWYFPLRGRHAAFGAAMVPLSPAEPVREDLKAQAQALCDQLGLALQRGLAQEQAEAAREEAQLQKVRNAMLAAISHDFRTPLASMLSAASALLEQRERLSVPQQERLASSIVDECRHLSRLTDNALQLARLDSDGVKVSLDWESPQELAGAVLARCKARNAGAQLRLRVAPGTPLVRCDALLISQLLENLLDNALKYAATAPIELLVRRQGGHVVLAVRDRGPGVEPQWRERIFEMFQRGEPIHEPPEAGVRMRSAGVGLAVCRAIAQAHGGELRLRPRSRGGSSFECWLPEHPLPPMNVDEAKSS